MKKDKLHKLYNSCVKHNCLGDVSIIDPNSIPDHDLFTYSFPCQDISVAGNQKGLEKGSGTRSGLLWECEKIIAAKKPKYLLMENVKNLVSKKFKADFDKWCEWLETQGYKNFYKVLNAKDYGVPQNRERVFMVSILDENATYEFPQKFTLELRLKDILEDVVDEKYYIDNEASNRLLKALEEKRWDKQNDLQKIGNIYPSNGENGNIYMTDGLSPTIKSGQGVVGNGVGSNNAPKVVEISAITDKIINVGNINPSSNGMNGNVIDSVGLAGAVTTNKGEGQKIVIDKSTNSSKNGDTNCITNREDEGISSRQSEVPVRLGNIYGEDKGTGFAGNVWSKENISPTLTTMQGGNRQPMTLSNYRIRKLTPKECWRLMGMKDEHFEKCIDAGLSNSQLYKQAGNSIVVDVLEYIFKELFKEYIESNK